MTPDRPLRALQRAAESLAKARGGRQAQRAWLAYRRIATIRRLVADDPATARMVLQLLKAESAVRSLLKRTRTARPVSREPRSVGRPRSFSDAELLQVMRNAESQKDAARQLGVSRQTVNGRLAKMSRNSNFASL